MLMICEFLSRIHYKTINSSEEGTVFIVTVRFVDDLQSIQVSSFFLKIF